MGKFFLMSGQITGKITFTTDLVRHALLASEETWLPSFETTSTSLFVVNAEAAIIGISKIE